MREKVAIYRPGQTFSCVKRPFLSAETFDPDSGWATMLGEPCGAEIVMHGYHWCAQVCPVCLANYRTGFGADMSLYLDTAGYYPPETERLVRASIAENGGQYVPRFDRR